MKGENNKMKKAVIYARYSSSAQSEQSIEGQLRVCNEFAEQNGYTVVNQFIDRAISGKTDKRPDFIKMIAEAENRNFNYVIVYKIDRFSRNHYDSVVYKHKLKKLGVKVVSATEMITDSSEGKLVEGILEIMAEMYSEDLKQKVTRGLKETALKGGFTGGTPPYGYKVIDKKVVIDENRARAINYLFKEYSEGKALTAIINELNEKGYRTDKGKKLTIRSFNNVLTNRKYIGEYDYLGVKMKNYPKIVNEDLFLKVQKQIKNNRKLSAKGKAKEEYILTGKAICGYCGTQMFGVCGTSKTKTVHNYYACLESYNHHNCKKKLTRKRFLEDAVIEKTLEFLKDKKNTNSVVDFIREEFQKNKLGSKNELKNLNDRLQTVNEDLDRCSILMLKTTSEEMLIRFEEMAKDLELQKSDIIKEVAKYKIADKIISSSQSELNKWVELFKVGDINDVNFRRRIIQLFVNKVFVFDNTIAVFYNIMGENDIDLEQLKSKMTEEELLSSNITKGSPPNYAKYELGRFILIGFNFGVLLKASS